MSARHRGRGHTEHPDAADRARTWRATRRRTRTALHVSLTSDPELGDTALPEVRPETRRPVTDAAPPQRSTRLRHWKTREWKRRSAERRRRAQATHDEVPPAS